MANQHGVTALHHHTTTMIEVQITAIEATLSILALPIGDILTQFAIGMILTQTATIKLPLLLLLLSILVISVTQEDHFLHVTTLQLLLITLLNQSFAMPMIQTLLASNHSNLGKHQDTGTVLILTMMIQT